MLPISIEEFAEMIVKANQDMNKKELIKALRQALEEKNNGAKCIVCGSPIWVNITVQMYPCSEGTDTDSPAL